VTNAKTSSATTSEALRDYWHPVAYAHELGASPLAVTLLERPLVLFRSGETLACFSDLCIHRGTALSKGRVQAGSLVCPYHGWEYGADGQCTRIPQQPPDWPIPRKASAKTYPCVERYGIVWVCLGEPAWEIASLPEWDAPGFKAVSCGPFTWRTSAARMVENFTDFGHFAFVHPGLLGDPERPIVRPYEVVRAGNELHYENDFDVPNPNDSFHITNLQSAGLSLNHNVYRLAMPFTIHLVQRFATGGRLVLYFACQPVSEKETRGFSILLRDYDHDVADSVFQDWEVCIFDQDQVVVETQRPEELPVDLSAELHLRFDRLAVEYRRWLGELAIESSFVPDVPEVERVATG